jgi:hypothetical protein
MKKKQKKRCGGKEEDQLINEGNNYGHGTMFCAFEKSNIIQQSASSIMMNLTGRVSLVIVFCMRKQ